MDYELLINQLSTNFNKSDLIRFDFEESECYIGAPLKRYFDELLGFSEEPHVMHEFVSCLIADLKMMLLADSLIWLNGFYAKKRNWEVDSEFETGFYYCAETFNEKLDYFIDTFKIDDGRIRASILNTEDGRLFKKLLPKRMPRLAFTWFGFALCRYYTDLTTNPERKTIYVVKGKGMSLQNIGEGVVPDPRGEIIVDQEQQDTILIKNILRDEYFDVNKSLSLYLCNNSTNLYDLYLCLSSFKMFYARYFEGLQDMGDNELWKFIKLKLFELSFFSNIKGIAVKHFLFHYKEDGLLQLNDRKTWIQLNDVIVLLKKHMESSLLRNCNFQHDSKYIDYEKNKHIYTVLREEEPYGDIIEEFTKRKGTIYSFTVSKDRTTKNRHSDRSFYMAYYYAHMHLYNTLFTEDKRKIRFENY